MHFALLSLWLVPFAATVLATNRHSQYCYSSESVLSSFCVSFARNENYTSQGIDLYLTFSALPTSVGGGWTAIGTGEYMAGSLMFIFWADESRENVAVSVRTATTHTEPFTDSGLPQVEVLQAEASKHGSHEVKLVCYSCGKWESLDFHDKAQPWIWAINYFTEFPSADPNSHLGDHQLHNIFYADMTALPPTQSSNREMMLPTIQGIENVGTWDQLLPLSSSTHHGNGFWHGTLMTVAFMGIMIPSAIYKRWKPNTSTHLWIQVAGSTLSLVGILLGLSEVNWRISSFGIHQTLGLITYCLIMLQIFLGTQIVGSSHEKHVRSYRQVHRWFGRGILALGISEAGLGLMIAGSGTTRLVVFLVSTLCELFLYLWLSPGGGSEKINWSSLMRNYGRKDMGNPVLMSEEDADLTDLVIEEDSLDEVYSKSHDRM